MADKEIPMRPSRQDRDQNQGEDGHHETSLGGDDDLWVPGHSSPGGGGTLHSGSSHHVNPGYEPDSADETPLIVQENEDAGDFLRSLYNNPSLDKFSYGQFSDGRVWINCQRQTLSSTT